jgi:hypothetical protein
LATKQIHRFVGHVITFWCKLLANKSLQFRPTGLAQISQWSGALAVQTTVTLNDFDAAHCHHGQITDLNIE